MAGLTRGAVCPVRLGRADGHAQSGRRFAVVVQSDDLRLLGTVIVAPTSTAARAASFRPEIVVEEIATRVLCEQLRAVDANRLGPPVATLSVADLRRVDDALELVLEL